MKPKGRTAALSWLTVVIAVFVGAPIRRLTGVNVMEAITSTCELSLTEFARLQFQ